MSKQARPTDAEMWAAIMRSSEDPLPPWAVTYPELGGLLKEAGLKVDVDRLCGSDSHLGESVYDLVIYAASIDRRNREFKYPTVGMMWDLLEAADKHGGNSLRQAVRGLQELRGEHTEVAFEVIVKRVFETMKKCKSV